MLLPSTNKKNRLNICCETGQAYRDKEDRKTFGVLMLFQLKRNRKLERKQKSSNKSAAVSYSIQEFMQETCSLRKL